LRVYCVTRVILVYVHRSIILYSCIGLHTDAQTYSILKEVLVDNPRYK